LTYKKLVARFLQNACAGKFDDIFRDIRPIDREPLLYLCFTRLSLPEANDNAVAIAKLLLEPRLHRQRRAVA